ncbi:phage tail protein [Nocardia puris]|uniref:phage tail protein n=1 Tax=Nocardia puris TaxID=208602 RepID=UPI001892EF1B|nr:phage tail protein [Nocardia puris]MBF6459799.1 phage tail protein [Nocardia puris]
MNPLLANEETKIVAWDFNGRVWHLQGAGAGRENVRITSQTGWYFGPGSLITAKGARQDGETYLRDRNDPKMWDFKVLVTGDGTVRGFHAVNDAWLRGWAKRTECTVGWYTRHQGWRFDRVRMDESPEPQTDIDPARNRAVEYLMSATALDPKMRHLDETALWVNSAGLNEGVVPVRNPADQEGWPRYTMPGPGRYHIGDPVGGDFTRIVETPKLEVGEELRIDTHPRHRTARVYSAGTPSGRNVWGQLAGRRWFASIPPWSSVNIPVRVTDGGGLAAAVRVDLTPRSSRPF